jgi:hypothetical protein
MQRAAQLGNKGKASLQAFSQLLNRMGLASRLGKQSFGGDRDIYEALGYIGELKFQDYYDRYERQDIAKAVIDRPVNATWQGALEIMESGEREETPLEKAWADMMRDNTLKIKAKLSKLDRMACLGEYAVLLFGLDDVKTIEDYAKPVTKGMRKLNYISVYSEGKTKIDTYDNRVNSPRYGQPVFYTVDISDVANRETATLKVHYTRILHVTWDSLESDIIGTPMLQSIFNRLMDLEKIIGGDGEMFWRGARPGYHGKVDPEFSLLPAEESALQEKLDEFEHHLRRFLINEGVDIEAFEQQIADPVNHVLVNLQMISADKGIPLRILIGSERGQLASGQDAEEWRTCIKARRESHAEPNIVRPFIEKCSEFGLLPKTKGDYVLLWEDLFAVSEKDRVEVGKNRAIALQAYTANPMAEAIIGPDAFLEFFCGFTTEQIQLVKSMRQSDISEELKKLFEMQIKTGGGEQPQTGQKINERGATGQ